MEKELTVGSITFGTDQFVVINKMVGKVTTENINNHINTSIELDIDDVPQSYNKILNMHWTKRKQWKNYWEMLVFNQARKCLPPKPIEICNIYIQFTFKGKRQHDLDNYAQKGLLDALKGKVIIDDSISHVRQLTFRGCYGDKNSTKIIIEPIGVIND